MGALNIQLMRREHAGQSDADAARAFAQEHGYLGIVRYKNSPVVSDFTNVGVCKTKEQIGAYLQNPDCHGAEVIYDATGPHSLGSIEAADVSAKRSFSSAGEGGFEI